MGKQLTVREILEKSLKSYEATKQAVGEDEYSYIDSVAAATCLMHIMSREMEHFQLIHSNGKWLCLMRRGSVSALGAGDAMPESFDDACKQMIKQEESDAV